MKRLLYNFELLAVLLFISLNASAQQTLVLQPDAEHGKDARIHSTIDKYNSGITPEFLGDAWTWGGQAGVYRSLIDFDLSNQPQPIIRSNLNGQDIISAKLYLYAYPKASSEGHSMLSGSNECLLQRITSKWDENTVTWKTQPSVTSINQVTIPATNDENKDYVIDVTQLIRDMFTMPDESFGMMLSIKDENYYRRMTFGSSDHPDPAKHPKLVINFDISSLQDINNSQFSRIHIYPNPANDQLNLKYNSESEQNAETNIFNITGQNVFSSTLNLKNGENTFQIDISSLPVGMYFISLKGKELVYSTFLKCD